MWEQQDKALGVTPSRVWVAVAMAFPSAVGHPVPAWSPPPSPSPAAVGRMAFTPLKPPQLCTGEGLCGCWLQPQRFRAWFQPCLWRPIFNIKTNQCKWNLYYLLKNASQQSWGLCFEEASWVCWGNYYKYFTSFLRLQATSGSICWGQLLKYPRLQGWSGDF